MTKPAKVRIGTSGWHYKHWVGRFYPEHSSSATMFRYYVEHFDTVELNNSFYRLPELSTICSWRDATAKDFCFAVKASRFITHNKKLKDAEITLENFLVRVEAFGEKLGPVLFQLPPRWKLNLERLEDFLKAVPRDLRCTFEFREPSWNTLRVFELLQKYNAAYCIYELAGYSSPTEITADWTYVRLHGPGGKYQGNYSPQTLNLWATQIMDWSKRLKNIYVYFDNDDSAYAAYNAMELKRLVGLRLSRSNTRKAA